MYVYVRICKYLFGAFDLGVQFFFGSLTWANSLYLLQVYACICMYVHVYVCICMYMQVYECILVYWYLYCYTSLKGPCFAVSLGCIHDEVRSEPGSWLVVGMIPVFDKKKAIQTKLRTEDGPMGDPWEIVFNCPRQFPSHILGTLPLVPAGLPRLRKPPVLHQLLGHDLASGLQGGC